MVWQSCQADLRYTIAQGLTHTKLASCTSILKLKEIYNWGLAILLIQCQREGAWSTSRWLLSWELKKEILFILRWTCTKTLSPWLMDTILMWLFQRTFHRFREAQWQRDQIIKEWSFLARWLTLAIKAMGNSRKKQSLIKLSWNIRHFYLFYQDIYPTVL
jgi:hypothetical protein